MVGHRGGQHHEHIVEVAACEGKFGSQAPPSSFFILARLRLQVLHAAQVDGDLAACAQAQDPLLHGCLAQPGNAVLSPGAGLLQFTQ